ncbi:flippase [Mesobacillus stamsii]|uniref:O-antigen/teichoic acid export membrane protein n=1 Tax=Mesobacillus stamsii TaxID=225347 RepID=A0ABU0G0D2_9BACI|nr:flippase [Mesobacillus stamsii]MDQ0415654.1 O-antigen/teichoic acid export membrane protein [Mesobacillus stamsii]
MKLKRIIQLPLIRSVGIYTVASILNSAIPFLLLPILTRYLTPEDYGIVSMFGVLVSLITPFIGLNIQGAVQRVYFKREKINIKIYITNCIYILLCSTAVVSLIFFLFSGYIAKITSLPEKLLFVAIAIAFAQFISSIVLVLWQVQIKPAQYGVYQISTTLLNASLSIWLIISLGMAWQGRILGQLVSFSLFGVIGILILRKDKWLKIKYNRSYIKHALSFGVPLIPHAVGGVVMTMTDRIFITNMVGIEATGIYTVGFQIGMIINILATSFNQAYVPWLFAQLKANIYTKKLMIVKMTYFYFGIIIFLALGLSFFAPWFLDFFVGKEFSGSSVFIIWIAIGYAFNGMYFMVTNYIFYAEKTAILAWITFGSAILNIGLNYVFISKYGAIGAAQATTIIYFIKFISTWILAARVYNMPWRLKKNENYIG